MYSTHSESLIQSYESSAILLYWLSYNASDVKHINIMLLLSNILKYCIYFINYFYTLHAIQSVIVIIDSAARLC